MWFDEAGEVVEMFKSSFPFSFLFFVPILIIISPVSPAAAAHEFSVFRMQQYDLQGSAYGCRNTLVNVEARPIESTMYTRRCVVSRLMELTVDKYKDLVSQSAGGLLVLLPPSLTDLSKEESEHLLELEQELLQEETSVPVYFVHETAQLLEIYHDIKGMVHSDQAASAAEALLSSAAANGFQMVVNGPQSKALNDFQIVNLQGKLSGYGREEQLPTIVIVTHYDSFGIAPSLSSGVDSNASGVAMMLELARLLSKLYSNSRTHAKYNILFLLSGAGKYNYQGTRRWIEDQQESGEPSLLNHDIAYVLCLDAMGASNELNLHVSKPPKEGSAGDVFYKNLEKVAGELYPEVSLGQMHKKINLADDYLAWEHERFSIRRYPAFTLSHISTHKELRRNSITDTRRKTDTAIVVRNTRLVAEALARHLFNLTAAESMEIFTDGLQVEVSVVEAWLTYLASTPRAAQLLPRDHVLLSALEETLGRSLKDVRRHTFRSDKRDPEFVFYDGAEFIMSAYNVKPAVFDLFLALGIAAYLGVLYVVVQNFGLVLPLLRKMIGTKLKKQ